jgi:hypothetical protein
MRKKMSETVEKVNLKIRKEINEKHIKAVK